MPLAALSSLTMLASGGAPATTTSELDLFPLLMGLLGGLALFLFGMEQLADALKVVAGERMRTILAKLTTNRVTGALTGAFVTAVIQSSSVTTVLVVGFVTAGLMSMSQSIGVIMGANIGTTITAQIIAFKVTKYALLLIAAGFAVMFTAKRERRRQQGAGVMGLGLIFFGMGVMSSAMEPLRDYQPFLDWMVRLENPILGILVGALFTALVQSSSATTGIVIVMASGGLISLPAGIALAFGSNIGTCVTALLASIGRPREALRAATVHVLFNVAGVLVWVGLIDQLAAVVTAVSPQAEELTGAARLAAEAPRQIANAHTIFNVANTVLFLGFAPWFARLSERLVPDRSIEEEAVVRAKYLDVELLSTPPLALDRVRLEILHMGDRTKKMLASFLPAVLRGDKEDLEEIAAMDDAVDELHGRVVTYLGQISQQTLSEEQTEEHIRLLEAANDLENIGDLIETNLVTIGTRRLEQQVVISDATREVIEGFHVAVGKAFDAAMSAVTTKSAEARTVVTSMKQEINRLADSAALHQAQRLVAEEPNRLPAYTVEMGIIENLKRIYYFTKRMARAAVPEAGGEHLTSEA
ncbi:MAG: Na/Pi cotransporter family protein [bacterium]|nr:Na/Pi cotransporter family protein [bacterium]